MGETPEGYETGFFQRIQSKLSQEDWQNIHKGAVYYQDILQPNQEDYYKRSKSQLDWKKLRKFMLYGFSDASSLETRKDGTDSPYYLAQLNIRGTLREAYKSVGKKGKVLIIAQSLGGQVMSNYLWDAQRHKVKGDHPAHGVWAKKHFDPTLPEDEDAFLRGSNIHYLVTTGCNIPLFVAGWDRSKIFAIKKPNRNFHWKNYFDEDDVLGWPLQTLSTSYNKLVEDHTVDSGGIFNSWTPFSHVNYWTDNSVLNEVVLMLQKMK
jgi:hypothetical protein